MLSPKSRSNQITEEITKPDVGVLVRDGSGCPEPSICSAAILVSKIKTINLAETEEKCGGTWEND